ncbi:hypothetical protein [Bradyrhizobium genosp. P]|uniref:hypothetical protein n=1 Tax=Bradyrhizobium genosp. P TaxID=83641 RepID=UPI003CF83148
MEYATFNARLELVLRVVRRTPKAAMIAMMTAVSVIIFTDTYWKALWIGAFAFLLSMFTTWRRFVEPISFIVFLAAVVVACIEPSTLDRIQTSVRAMVAR